MPSTLTNEEDRGALAGEAIEPLEERARRKAGRRAKKLPARRFQAHLVFAGLAAARISPSWIWNGPIARILARCAPRHLKHNANQQLHQALGDHMTVAARRSIVRAMFHHHVRSLREIAIHRRADASYVRRMIVADADFGPRVRALLERGKGLIIVTPHYGNYELMPAWLTRILGVPCSVVGKRIVNPWIDTELVAMRARHGVETIYQDESPRKLLRALASGRIVGILPDPDIVKLPGIFVDFFGRPAWTTTGAAHMSIVARAPLVPAFLTWTGDHYRLHLDEPVFPDRSAPREEEIRRITEAWSASFERAISANPDHWAWLHRRWRTTEERVDKRRNKQHARSVRASASANGRGVQSRQGDEPTR